MVFETETSIYEVKIGIGTLPKKSGIKILNQPLITVRKIAVKAGESSPVPAGQTIIGDQLKIEDGKLVLYLNGKQELRTSTIISAH